MSLRSKYAKQVRRTIGSGYHAAWYPDTKHALGAYGRMVDGVFTSYGKIEDLGITYDVDEDKQPSSLEIYSTGGVSLSTKAEGETHLELPHVPEASVGLGFDFKSEGAFVIASDEVYEDRIANPGALEAQLRKLRTVGMWDTGFRIVTGILRMPVAKVIISQAEDTKVELSLKGTLAPSIKDLGKASVSATVHFESTATVKYLPARDAMPIIQLHRLAPRFLFRPPRLRTFSEFGLNDPGAEEDWSLVLDEVVDEVEQP